MRWLKGMILTGFLVASAGCVYGPEHLTTLRAQIEAHRNAGDHAEADSLQKIVDGIEAREEARIAKIEARKRLIEAQERQRVADAEARQRWLDSLTPEQKFQLVMQERAYELEAQKNAAAARKRALERCNETLKSIDFTPSERLGVFQREGPAYVWKYRAHTGQWVLVPEGTRWP